MRYSFSIFIFLFLISINVFIGCGAKPYINTEPQGLDGIYIGTSENGEQVSLILRKQGNMLIGNGMMGGKNFTFMEDITEKVAGTMTFPDGTMQSVSIEPSLDGKATLDIEGQAIALSSGATAPYVVKYGPLSGYYETKEIGSFMNAIYLIQIGNIVSGNAIVSDHKVLIQGMVQVGNSFRGYAILPDETQIEFEANLEGKNKLIVDGIGKPVTFHRKDM